jgi:hypothetical protein
LVAGLSGADYQNPLALEDGFHTAMLAGALLAAAGGALAWLTISNDVLARTAQADREPLRAAIREAPEHHCAVAGTPLGSVRGSRRTGQPQAAVERGRT